MNSDIHEIERNPSNLLAKEQGHLTHNRLLSLDTEELDENVEQKWINESIKRRNDFKEGKTQAIPFNDAMKKTRDSLK